LRHFPILNDVIGGQFLRDFEVARIFDLQFAFGVESFHDGVGGTEDGVARGGVGLFEDVVDVGYFAEELRFEEGVVLFQECLDGGFVLFG